MGKWEVRGQEVAQALQKLKDESAIKILCDGIVDEIRKAYPDTPNSRKSPLASIRNAVKSAFSATKTQQHPWQYSTKSGKGNIERWEHIALKYLTLSSQEWDEMGDEARKQWKTQQQVERQPEATQTETKLEAQITTLDTMNISQLNLDAETQQIVESAIASTKMNLADFVRKALVAYAKSVTAKEERLKQDFPDDIQNIPTSELLTKKYNTYPGRGEELTRRAIAAMKLHNDRCTEKSQKWYITASALQRLTGAKPTTVNNVVSKYEGDIVDHNAKHGFTDPKKDPYHNRKPGQDIREEIDIVALVPNGID